MPPGKAAGSQVLRIIGGEWRGRKLTFPAIDGLRPTGDRLRETLFNWLQWQLPRARCLDLFAGSGALGLEALSRGAAQVQFVELDRAAARAINGHLELLGSKDGKVFNGSAGAFLQQPPEPFDIVFVDPPFAGDLWQQALVALQQGWLAPDALVYIESPKHTDMALPPDWELLREKRSGQVCMRLLRTPDG
ncbi:16S rRNA (guanine(966)-N(2))-methyltransferase RsmD [Biformimicrobium ophioploci]|uniref:16S rRNA (guanine(966)-N(2))-methyltransferase RsmD n=1 Tax=Biformimicrobium ophioploci TaxID=3036711 RepID=UPI002553EBD5|nr:16S rRNA (guanine(966)-N(2))-methyltransferase RsmD [Microbulbifer sp. NKW57]